MVFSIIHTTRYRYNAPISFCHNIATIRPRVCTGQEIQSFDLQISPQTLDLSERLDFFGNNITRFSIQQQHQELKVTSKSIIIRQYASVKASFFTDQCKKITVSEALFSLKSNDNDILEAKQFENFLFSTEAQKILKDFGYLTHE